MTSRDTSGGKIGKTPADKDWNAIEPERSAMRVLVANIELELGKLGDPQSVARTEALTRLTTNWTKLVSELALGPEPSLRACPFCHLSIRRAATRCRYCLKKSPAAPAGRTLDSAPVIVQGPR